MKTFSAKLNTVYLVIMYLVFTGKYRFDMEKEGRADLPKTNIEEETSPKAKPQNFLYF